MIDTDRTDLARRVADLVADMLDHVGDEHANLAVRAITGRLLAVANVGRAPGAWVAAADVRAGLSTGPSSPLDMGPSLNFELDRGTRCSREHRDRWWMSAVLRRPGGPCPQEPEEPVRDDDQGSARTRSAFQAFAGHETFRQWTFLAVNARGPFLAPHRRDVWASFRKQHPAAPRADAEVRRLFLWCHLHDVALLVGQVRRPAFGPSTMSRVTHTRRSHEWYQAAEAGFPHGHGGIDTLCSLCVEAHLAWLAGHPGWQQ